MQPLSDFQVHIIEQIIKQQVTGNATLRAELLDHVCCQVESKMQLGTEFSEALRHSLSLFEEDEMKKINQTFLIHHFKKRIMTYSLTAILAAFAFFWSLPVASTEQALSPMVINQAPSVPPSLCEEPPSGLPLPSGYAKVVSGYGQRMHPVFKKRQLHRGCDFRAPADHSYRQNNESDNRHRTR